MSREFLEVASGLSRGGCEDVDSVMVWKKRRKRGGCQL